MNKPIHFPFIIIVLILLISCEGRKGKIGPIYRPIPIALKDTIKPTVNVYIENSGSMDGYVNRGNEFTDFVSTYMTDISINFTDDINVNYINSEIIPLGKDITDFTSKLDVSTFKSKGGNRDETHIFQLLDTILQLVDNNEISIFITDGIFSPGQNRNAQNYINDQYNGIKKSMADYYKKHPNAAVIIYQFISEFNGTFYNRDNTPFPNTKENLPYYVWIIGDCKHLKDLMEKIPEKKFKGNGVRNTFSITGGPKGVDYAVKMGSGNFDLNKQEPKTTIENLKKVNRGGGCSKSSGKVKFSVNANLSSFLLSDNYLRDKSNYEMNNKDFDLTICNSVPNSFGYTHQLNYESGSVHKGVISVKLKTLIPQWVEHTNDSLGTAAVKGKTYGIKYQIHGVYEAFTISNNYYTEIKIKIN